MLTLADSVTSFGDKCDDNTDRSDVVTVVANTAAKCSQSQVFRWF